VGADSAYSNGENGEKNTVIVCLNQQTVFVPQQDPCAIEIDHKNRNCYNCGEFGHMAKHCRNSEIGGRGRRLEYRKNRNNKQRRMIKGGNG